MNKFISHTDFKKKLLQDAKLKKLHHLFDFEFGIIRRMMDFKIKYHLNRKEFSKRFDLSLYLLDKFMLEPEQSRLNVLKKIVQKMGLKLTVK